MIQTFSVLFYDTFSYVNYSNIAAKLLRRALKPEFRTEAVRREDSSIKFTPWKDGKAQSKFHPSVLSHYYFTMIKPNPFRDN
jgi:F-type H+-transporting ATPase subunit epsilon